MEKIKEAIEAARKLLADAESIARHDAIRVEDALDAALGALESSVLREVEKVEAVVEKAAAKKKAD